MTTEDSNNNGLAVQKEEGKMDSDSSANRSQRRFANCGVVGGGGDHAPAQEAQVEANSIPSSSSGSGVSSRRLARCGGLQSTRDFVSRDNSNNTKNDEEEALKREPSRLRINEEEASVQGESNNNSASAGLDASTGSLSDEKRRLAFPSAKQNRGGGKPLRRMLTSPSVPTSSPDAAAITKPTSIQQRAQSDSSALAAPSSGLRRATTADDSVLLRRAKQRAALPRAVAETIQEESATVAPPQRQHVAMAAANCMQAPPPTSHTMELDIPTKIVQGQARLQAVNSAAIEALEAQQRQMQEQQQRRRHQLQRPACEACDDCLKGLPCLVVTLEAGPGAFSVHADSREELRSLRPPQLTTDPDNRRRESLTRYSPTSSPHSSSRPSIKLAVAEAVTAELVESDDEGRAMTQREKELMEREQQLAAQAAQLQALQEQLERQRLEMAGGAATTTAAVVTVSVAPAAAAQVVVAEVSPVTSRRPSGTSRSHASGGSSTNHSASHPQQHRGKAMQDYSSSTTTAAGHHYPEHPESLGEGPMRFAPPGGYNVGASTRHQLMGVDSQSQLAFKLLDQKWRDRQDKLAARYGSTTSKSKILFNITTQWHFRFLWATAKINSRDGSHQFHVERAFAAEKKLQKRFFSLNIAGMRQQLKSKTLFPVPGLKTMGGHEMFYMRPSRYFPNQTSVKAIIDNLVYVMNTMLENSQFAQKEGIGFIACMDDWKMKNFDVKYCYQFMMALQGGMVPVKTQLFLIVNPPSWFGAIWKIMKPMLAPSFRKRVKICPEFKIAKYLQSGFEQFLPDDMTSGTANTDAMVRDFIAYRNCVERGGAVDDTAYEENSVYGSSHGDHDDMQSVGQFSLSHNSQTDSTNHGSFSTSKQTSRGQVSLASGEQDDASIHCDIDDDEDLEEEDMKPNASSNEVRIDNLPML